MRKYVVILTTFLLIISIKPVNAGETTFTIGEQGCVLNGLITSMDTSPYIKNGRTYIPLRQASIGLGVAEENVLWDETTKTVTLIKGDKVVQVTIGDMRIRVNGVYMDMGVSPEITNGRTMLPIRFVSQAFGGEVSWNDELKQLRITENENIASVNQELEVQNGYGTITMEDGSIYKGEIQNGLPHGIGIQTFSDRKIEGVFRCGIPNGQCKITWFGGYFEKIYEGPIEGSCRDGFGKLTVRGVFVYEGDFKQGLFEGNGTLTYEDGTKYIGEFSDDKFNGYGQMIWTEGSSYVGSFKDGLRHGTGTYIFPDGAKNYGTFIKGEFTYGTVILPDGSKFSYLR